MRYRTYPCPRCGAPDSSDGEHYCARCEVEYRRAQAQLARDAYERYRARLPPDGDWDGPLLTLRDFEREYGL